MSDTKRHGSISPEFALLGFLYEQPSHGYDLHQKLVTELGFVWRIAQSQTYTILKRLESRGDVSSTVLEQEKLPSRQVLKITRQGKDRFKEWLELPTVSSVRAIRLEFVTRLYFAQNLKPQMILPMLATQTGEVQKTIARLEAGWSALPKEQTINRLSLQLRIQQLESVLEWLAECSKAF